MEETLELHSQSRGADIITLESRRLPELDLVEATRPLLSFFLLTLVCFSSFLHAFCFKCCSYY